MAQVLGTVVALLLLEGVTRLFADAVGISSYLKYDPELGWSARPNTIKHHKDDRLGFDVTYHINAHGFRGQPYETQKSSGTKRILLLGDSNAFGWGIPEGEQLAALLDAEVDGVEVINLALSGYGTDQAYLRFVREGLPRQPDLVILGVTHNDFDEIQHPFFNQKAKPQFVLNASGDLELVNVPAKAYGAKAASFNSHSIPLPFREWLSWHSYAYNFLNERYHPLSRQLRSRTAAAPPPPVFSRDSVRLFNAIVMQLARRITEVGARGLIVHASKDVHEHDGEIARTMPVIDMYPQFEEAQRSGQAPWYRDGYHWTRLGNRLIADRVIELLRDGSYLSPAATVPRGTAIPGRM